MKNGFLWIKYFLNHDLNHKIRRKAEIQAFLPTGITPMGTSPMGSPRGSSVLFALNPEVYVAARSMDTTSRSRFSAAASASIYTHRLKSCLGIGFTGIGFLGV